MLFTSSMLGNIDTNIGCISMKVLDNINTLWGDDLKKEMKAGSKFKIAASCFSIYAYAALKKELEKLHSFKFIFTTPAFVPSEVTDKLSKERREFHIPKQQRELDLYGTEFEIQLKNKLTQRAIAKECADWIRRKATFYSNTTKTHMQQFACLNSKNSAATYLPLTGFTAVELGYQSGNAMSNFINKFDEAPHTNQYLQLFEQMWNDKESLHDVTESICMHIESVYQENSPEKIYFLMLYNIFNEFLEDLNADVMPNDLTGYKDSVIWNKLFNFQKDAATGIINKLEKYNGCILADSVGLGKTFTALAVIKYYEDRNRLVLVLTPKKIADNWTNYKGNLKTNIFVKDRLRYDVLCHTDLQRTKGTSLGLSLNNVNWGNYDLVVIDESHNFRNNDTYKEKETRYKKLLDAVIRDGVKTKVLMLSATPVNNRFADLRNQLALAYEGESENLSKKLQTTKSIEEIFKQAQTAFNEWSRLPIEKRTAKAILNKLHFDFFELLDSVTIARSRKHIETFYDISEIGKFPTRRKPISFRCQLTSLYGVMKFDAIYEQLSLLKLAVYAPLSYILPSRLSEYEAIYDTTVEGGKTKLRQADRERSLQRLMTTLLLKRLESSVEAFRLTLTTIETNHINTLASIEKFKEKGASIPPPLPNVTYNPDDDDDFIDLETFMTEGKVQIKLTDMDLLSWKSDLQYDLFVIGELLEDMRKVDAENDLKLQHVKQHVMEKIQNPINANNKKIVIFTAYADTANYLYANLAPDLLQKGIHSGRITGKDKPKNTLKNGYDFQEILTLFSPISKEKALTMPNEKGEIDIVIGTDCISEGQNLQDCDYLINYDIHWNPVRIIQRFGRIDRIGSLNECIQLVNYWPDISLDEYINLKERVENRMHIVDLTATGDDNVLSAQANDVEYRTEQLRRLQDEVVELEDLKTGVNITDLGLNDFRMDLLNYIKEHNDLGHLPSGLHAVVPANADKGLFPGVIFTLRNRNASEQINQHNRLHPYYLVYVGKDGNIITDHTQVKPLLDKVRKSCKGLHSPIHEVCKIFNTATHDGKEMTLYSELLGQAIRSMISVQEDKTLNSLFTGSSSTAFMDTIKGLDDFELIAFLVIQES